MKRNRCLDRVFPKDLDPLTSRILAKMGSKGSEIRRRLHHLIAGRTPLSREGFQEPSIKR
jgi:hypothetical protein